MSLDWLLVALLLLPFAARLFGGGGKPQLPPGDGSEPREEGEEWSAGWSEWPAESAGEAAADLPAEAPEIVSSEEGPSAPTPRELRPSPPASAPRHGPGPSAAAETVPARPPLPEPHEVDRVEEHERFHRTVAATGARRRVAPPPLVTGDRAVLRRAILLREVLGPPRALQPLESERA
ncbi:hypothetical protein BH20GEM2_BH20GEM2_13570 [soil metagenome]